MGEEHRHRILDKTGPPVPPRIVRDLLAHETGDQGRPHIQMTVLGDPVER